MKWKHKRSIEYRMHNAVDKYPTGRDWDAHFSWMDDDWMVKAARDEKSRERRSMYRPIKRWKDSIIYKQMKLIKKKKRQIDFPTI